MAYRTTFGTMFQAVASLSSTLDTRAGFIQGTVLRARRSVAARCEPHVGVVRYVSLVNGPALFLLSADGICRFSYFLHNLYYYIAALATGDMVLTSAKLKA